MNRLASGLLRHRWGILALVLVAAIVIGANVAAAGQVAELDLSPSRRFSLTPDTMRLIHAVRSHLEITAFLSSIGGEARDARYLLDRYHQINPRITSHVMDPDANPGAVKRFGITQYGTTVLTYEGRRVDAPDAEELEISGAILRLLRGGTPVICTLVGHGEPSITDSAPQGFSDLAQVLKNNDYTVRTLDLTTGGGQVPADCAVVLLAGPVDPLLGQEINSLVSWAKAGGRLMVLATPLTRGDPNPLLNPWDIHYLGGLVLDTARNESLDESDVIVTSLPSVSPVVTGIQELQFPAGGGLAVEAGTRGGLTVERLAVTSSHSQSWVETRPDTETTFDSQDVPGPVTVAASADDSHLAPGPPTQPPSTSSSTTSPPVQLSAPAHIVRTRVVATGGDVWATNAFLENLGNERFLLNSLTWLTQQEQLIASTSRPNQAPALPLTPERRTKILVITVGMVPALIILLGLAEAFLLRRARRRPAAGTSGTR